MTKALNFIFWGYLIVLVRIDFGIDILPSPVGYLLIAKGLSTVDLHYSAFRKGRALATAMIFLSLLTVFLDVHQQTHILWKTYSLFILTMQLIVVYFILKGLIKFALSKESAIYVKRLNLFANIYIGSHLIYLLALSFTPNLAFEDWQLFLIVCMFFVFFMDIIFLFYIRNMKWRAEKEMDLIVRKQF